jgi:hypothetical protein
MACGSRSPMIPDARTPGTDTRCACRDLHAWLCGGIVLVAFFVEARRELGGAAYRTHAGRRRGGRRLRPRDAGPDHGGRAASRGTWSRSAGGGAGAGDHRGGLGRGLLSALGDRAGRQPVVAYVGFGLMGLGASVVAPMALALAGRIGRPAADACRQPRDVLGYGPSFVGPPLMGLVSDVSACARPSPGGVSV